MIAWRLCVAMAPYLAKLGVFAACAFLGGRAGFALAGLRFAGVPDCVFLCTTLGVCGMIGVLLLLGITGLLNPVAILVAGLVLSAGSVVVLVRRGVLVVPAPGRLRMRPWCSRLALAVSLAAIVVPLLPGSLLPAVSSDGVTYHLPYARYFLQCEGIRTETYLRYPYFPLNYNLLYSLALAFGDDVMAHFVHAFGAYMSALGVYCLGHRLGSRLLGLAAMAAFLYGALVRSMLGAAYIDLGLTWFASAAFYCLFAHAQDKQCTQVFAGAVFVGCAAGCKYSGLTYLALYLLWAVFEVRRVRPVLRCFAVAVLVAAPWYVRNAVLSGNPVSPFASRLFGPYPWSMSDTAEQAWELSLYGIPRTLGNWFAVPLRLWTDPNRFHGGTFPLIGMVGLYAIPLGLLIRGPLRKMALLLLTLASIWFLGPQVKRYMVPIFPFLCLFPLAIAWHLVTRSVRWFRSMRPAPGSRRGLGPVGDWLVAGLAVVAAVQVAPRFWTSWVPHDAATRRAFREREVPWLRAVEELDKQPGRGIYALGCATARWFTSRRVVGDWFGVGRYATILGLRKSPERIPAALDALGCDFLLMRLAEPFDLRSGLPPAFELVYQDHRVAAYRVRR